MVTDVPTIREKERDKGERWPVIHLVTGEERVMERHCWEPVFSFRPF